MIVENLIGKFYKIAIRLVMRCGKECWIVENQHIHKMGVSEMSI